MANLTIEETRSIKILISQLRAFVYTLEGILNSNKAAESSRYVAYRDMAQVYNNMADQAKLLLKVQSIMYAFDVGGMRGYADTLWGEQKRILEQVLVAAKLLQSSLEGNLDFVEDEVSNLENFIAKKLRSSIFETPAKELCVQNAVESLLIGRGMNKGTDYDRESGKVEFSGKEYIPDFIVPKLGLCIEVKLVRPGHRSKVVDEISADITAYSRHYERILFIVYDLGTIRDEAEFRRDIEASGNIKVVIVKH